MQHIRHFFAEQRYFMSELIILAALLFSIIIGWGLANGGLLAVAVLLLPAAVFGGIIALLLAARPFLALCLNVAVLTTAPLLRIYLPIQDIPLYVIDVLLGLALVGIVWQSRYRGLRPSFDLIQLCLVGFTISVLISSAVLAVTVGGTIQIIYATGRYLLSTVGLFCAIVWLAQTPHQQRLLCMIVLAGATVNAVLSIMQNLPGIQVLGVEIPRFLYGSGSVPDFRYERILAGDYKRGFGLYQSATALSGVLDIALILCLMGGLALFKRNLWAYGLGLVLLTGMLATYSRHAILSLALVIVVGVFVLPKARALVRLLLTMAVLGPLVLSVGIIDLTYLTSRSSNVLEDQSTFARVEGLGSFFEYAREQPQRIIIGNGIGWTELRDRNVIPPEEVEILMSGFVSNAYPLIAYNIGILGLVSYLTLLGYVLYQGIVYTRRRHGTQTTLLLGLTAAVLTGAILHPFDNYFSESNETRAYFWLMLALTTSILTSMKEEATHHDAIQSTESSTYYHSR
jgi:hypothetical protein